MKTLFRIVLFASFCLPSLSFANLKKQLNETFDIFETIGQPLEFNNKTKRLLRRKAVISKTLKTRETREIPYYLFNFESKSATSTILYIGGIHPNEFAASYMSWKMLEEIINGKVEVPENVRLIYIPLSNPDGWIGGYKRRGYPTRSNAPFAENKEGSDLNRQFIDPIKSSCADVKLEPEIELIQSLISRTGANHWVALHSALNAIELDGAKTEENLNWQNSIAEASQTIPASVIGTYQWTDCKGSLGRLANLMAENESEGEKPGLITFELPGPRILNQGSKMQSELGRSKENASLAKDYYAKYRSALFTALKLR